MNMPNNAAGSSPLGLLREFLESHASPSIVVEHSEILGDVPIHSSLVYANPSFTSWIGDSTLNVETFKEWAEDSSIWSRLEYGKTESVPYARLMWVASLVGDKRFGILQSQSRYETPLTPDTDESYGPRKRPRTLSHAGMLSGSTTQDKQSQLLSASLSTEPHHEDGVSLILDWTRFDIPNAPEFVKWLRSFDWSRTKIGPMGDWSAAVRQTMIAIVMNPKARCVYFGLDDPVMLYNEACSKLLGHRHPAAMGAAGAVGAGPAWTQKYEGIKEVWSLGVATESHDYYHPIPRGGLPLEEAYFSWSIMPIVDDSGRMVGVQKEFWETTTQVIHTRRERTIEQAEKMVTFGDTMSTYWTKMRAILDSSPEDFPFCLLYSAPQESQPVSASSFEDLVPKFITLEGTVGLDTKHPIAVRQISLTNPQYLLAKHFRTAWIKGKPVALSDKDHTLPERLRVPVHGRGHGSACRSAMACPIRRLDGPGSVGFLLFGLNPQRPYDDPYRSFIMQLMDKFVKAAAAILVPEEREKLKQQWQIARDQERVFTRLAEFASVGLAIYEPTGALRWYVSLG